MTNEQITREDARAWGRAAFEMGLSLEEARRCIGECGCPARLLADVDATYYRAQSEALHREG